MATESLEPRRYGRRVFLGVIAGGLTSVICSIAKRRAMYAAAESLPAVPVPRPSRASLARYRTSRMTEAVSGFAAGAGAEADGER